MPKQLYSQALFALLQRDLHNFAMSYRGIDTIILANPNGFQIASYCELCDCHTDKMAELSSQLFAKSHALIKAGLSQSCQSVIIESNGKKIYITPTHHPKLPLILTIQTTDQAILGNIIHGAKWLNNRIGLHINQSLFADTTSKNTG